ncbi:uncharacterized protein LOC106061672 isoform X1 [Biomphalaria glabrata]|uniref:Uncharacterized protein LOC106061672 isoform X1 n=1 Tax=Biomphalaria glabrata TaxID=6526 RepID=A0A9W3A5S2_BIOGL|nr:uncharacterized protein LOC106061672 isoform X1 [Biomphalaria glabrata]
MSGISLPIIPGATPAPARVSGGSDHGGSRPGSGASGHNYFQSPVGYSNYRTSYSNPPSRSYGVAKVYHHLPSLKYNPGGHASRSTHKQLASKSLTNNIRARYSARHRRSPGPFSKNSADSPYLPTPNSEECLKCLLRVPHRKCEAHKYIRVGGGYRHGYWYIKCLLEQLEIQRQKELQRLQRLEAIKEHRVKAIKTYIRTKSGRLIEKIIFLSEEDYEAFKSGKNVEDILKKYLTKDEAEGLQSWDKDEVVAIKTYVRTKSGRLIEKLIYVSKEDYDAIKAGKKDAKEILKNYLKPEDGEQIEGWGEAKMRTIKTYVRTKSGRLVEKIIMISEEDYQAMLKEGKDPNEIIKKYITLQEGETIDSWQSGEPMKAIKTMIRTKSGRLIEKTIYVSADDYERMMNEMAKGGDPNEILKKYLNPEDGAIESWEKVPEGNPMKVIKTYVRTKSGRLIEKTVMLTEDEYNEFIKSGGDPNFLKKFMDLKKGEVIENWEKASTVYSDKDDQELQKAKAGDRIIGKDGTVYEVYVDPVTGKKYKKKVGNVSDMDKEGKGKKGKKGRGGKGGDGSDEETAEERERRKKGKRNKDSDSEYSYRSVYSAGGTKHVRRRRKRADGTYSDSESYHSDQDADGEARRRRRRRERAHGADSAHSYYSVVSAGGTRHVRRRKKHADGTYSRSVSYHSSDSGLEGGGLSKKNKKNAKKKKEHGSDSEYSYFSETSEGGTRRTMRKKRIRDADGKVIGHGKAESYISSDSDSESVYTEVSDGKGGKIRVKKEKPGRGKKGKKPGEISEDVDLENMTEEERQKYFEEKAKRKAEREKRRREKYGDKYDEMMEAHEKKKKEKKEAEERAKKGKGKNGDDSESEYEIDPITGEKKKKKKNKIVSDGKYTYEYDEQGRVIKKTRIGAGGDDSGSEYEYEYDEHGNLINERKKKGNKPGDGDEEFEYVYDKDGKLIKKIRKGKGGDDSGSEYEYEYDEHGNIIKEKRKGKKPGEEDKEYEYIYDKDGKLIKKVRKGKGDDDEGSEYEYEYDKDGNLIGTKKTKGKPNSAGSDDGNYFEVDEKGQIRLRPGRRKIDLSKLTDDDLRKLGIDPTLSKQEIARLLKQKFGDDIEIFDEKQKVGTKRLSEYGSDADTDDLANDSDLDITTLKGTRRVNVLMKRGGQVLLDHMKRVLDQSNLQDDTYAKDLDERDGDIDFLSHYKLVDGRKLESYARAFVVEDEDFDTVIRSRETKQAIEGVASVNHITPKQLEYVFKVLKIDDASQVTFRMFAVISSLCERVTQMDPVSKHLLEICDLLDIERKMTLYKAMFYTNVKADRDPNFIKADSLKIELIAGGLNWKQQEFIIEKLQPNYYNEISFLDYICYIPLFLSMHDNIIDNPLDMNNNKYEHMLRRPSGLPRQRDNNPLGNPLSRDSNYQNKQLARDLLEGKIDVSEIKAEKRELINKYTTLPTLLQEDKEISNVSEAARKTSR